MEDTFDPIDYANLVGKELVEAFGSANKATTSVSVGDAKETAARKKLEHLLPPGIGVGSGFVIDSDGGTSNQIDVVIYEKHICPVYSINDTPDTTYYPCEGVIAVGEIKSSLASRELSDIFNKIASVKHLKRFSIQRAEMNLVHELGIPYRNYGTTSPVTQRQLGVLDYSQEDNPLDQIFGFALADKLKLKPGTLCKNFIEQATERGTAVSPNLIVSLDKGVLCPNTPPDKMDERGSIKLSLEEASGVYHVNKEDENFRYLISMLYQVYIYGRTVPVCSFGRYFDPEGVLTLPGDGIYLPFTPQL